MVVGAGGVATTEANMSCLPTEEPCMGCAWKLNVGPAGESKGVAEVLLFGVEPVVILLIPPKGVEVEAKLFWGIPILPKGSGNAPAPPPDCC